MGGLTVPALVSDDGCAVDARPLIDLGIVAAPASVAPPSRAPEGPHPCFRALADERVASILLRRLDRTTRDLAAQRAAELDEDPAQLRRCYLHVVERWLVRLWRLEDRPARIARSPVAATVLVPWTAAESGSPIPSFVPRPRPPGRSTGPDR